MSIKKGWIAVSLLLLLLALAWPQSISLAADPPVGSPPAVSPPAPAGPGNAGATGSGSPNQTGQSGLQGQQGPPGGSSPRPTPPPRNDSSGPSAATGTGNGPGGNQPGGNQSGPLGGPGGPTPSDAPQSAYNPGTGNRPNKPQDNFRWDSFRLGDSPVGADGVPVWVTKEGQNPADWTRFEHFGRLNTPYWKTGYIWMRGHILAERISGPSILMLDTTYDYEIYLGQRLIYQDGGMNRSEFKLKPNVPKIINLPLTSVQEPIFVRVYTPLVSTHLGNLMVGDRAGLETGLIRDEWLEVGNFFLFFLLGLVALIIYFINRENPVTFYFALFALFISLNILLSLNMIPFLEGAGRIEFYVHETMYGATAFVFSRYFIRIVRSRFKAWIERVGTVALIGGVLLSVCKLGFPSLYIAAVAYVLPWYGWLYTLACLGLLLIILPSLKRKGEQGVRLFVFGFSVFFLLSVVDLPLRMTNKAIPRLFNFPPHMLERFLHDAQRISLLFMVFYFGFHLIREYASVYRDIKRQTALLEENNRELRRLDELKDYFLANTSHELRTPLHGIIGISESLAAGAAGDLSEQVKGNIQMIAASGRRLASLVNDLLDFSKLRHEDMDLQLRPVGLRQAVEIVMAMLQPLMRNKPLTCLNEVPQECIVEADEDRLQQILYNLIGNAVKFTETGEVRVTAVREGNEGWQVRIEDTGIGIAKENQSRIFESFEQADASVSRQFGGTGLGLPITKRLVQLHGSDLSLESELGRGSVFMFGLTAGTLSEQQASTGADAVGNETAINRLRQVEDFGSLAAASAEYVADRVPSPAAGAAGVEPADHDTPCILIVDDEPINLQVLNNYLAVGQYRVIQASGGMQALELLRGGLQPDLLILDVMMPSMTGFELTGIIRRELATASQLPILLLTAKNQVADLIEGFDSGSNDYLTKPVSQGELLARVILHLQLAQWNRTLEAKVQDRMQAVRNLLDNAGQGFLSLDAQLAVQAEYSLECERIFGGSIAGLELPDLLYPNDADSRLFVRSVLQDIMTENDALNREVLLSLLPEEATIEEKAVRLQFRMIPESATVEAAGRLMVILSDISQERQLERAMEQERQVLKLVVRTVTFYKDFKELVNDYRNFANCVLPASLAAFVPLEDTLQLLLREAHTFKGNFSQMHFLTIVEQLHAWETQLMDWKKRLQTEDDQQQAASRFRDWLEQQDLLAWLEADLLVLRQFLGDGFDQEADTVTVEKNRLLQLERMVEDVLSDSEISVILPELKQLRYVPFRDLLKLYPQHVERLARRAGKRVEPVEVEGPEVRVDPDFYNRFAKSLIHVFQNMVDHGIEEPEERLTAGKPAAGRISCEVRLMSPSADAPEGQWLLTIANDGRAIDLARIRMVALEKGMESAEFDGFTRDEQLMLIFQDAFTTRQSVTLVSGRGVGLSAVRQTVEELHGSIHIISDEKRGTVFEFRLPLNS